VSGYQQDLAFIHDTGFTAFVRKSAPGLLRMLQQNGIQGGLVVDAGCGSGVWARLLCDAGYEALGIDQSPSMIRLARKQAPRAKFQVASFLDAKMPACDAVTSIGECVNYAFDPGRRKELPAFFRKVYDAVRPGGMFVFDIVEPGLITDAGPQRRYSEGPGWAILLEVREDKKRRMLTRRIISFRQLGKLYRRSEEIHRLHLYKASELLEELRKAGFEARVLRGYGRFRFARAHAALMARKPA